jgi:hypothetical protein
VKPSPNEREIVDEGEEKSKIAFSAAAFTPTRLFTRSNVMACFQNDHKSKHSIFPNHETTLVGFIRLHEMLSTWLSILHCTLFSFFFVFPVLAATMELNTNSFASHAKNCEYKWCVTVV